MLLGTGYAGAHRMWFVPDIVIWGLPGLGEIEFVALEQVGSDKSVLYGSVDIGESAQKVTFSDLTDHRGNQLPDEIDSPSVWLRPHTADDVLVVGKESDASFKVARGSESNGPVTADLLIIELGA